MNTKEDDMMNSCKTDNMETLQEKLIKESRSASEYVRKALKITSITDLASIVGLPGSYDDFRKLENPFLSKVPPNTNAVMAFAATFGVSPYSLVNQETVVPTRIDLSGDWGPLFFARYKKQIEEVPFPKTDFIYENVSNAILDYFDLDKPYGARGRIRVYRALTSFGQVTDMHEPDHNREFWGKVALGFSQAFKDLV